MPSRRPVSPAASWRSKQMRTALSAPDPDREEKGVPSMTRRTPDRAGDPGAANGSLRELVSPLGGLIESVVHLGTEPGFAPFPVSLATVGDLTQVLPTVSAATGGRSTRHELDGAGGAVDPAHASLLSIAEALERYSCCVYDDAQFRVATGRELGDDALDLRLVPRCSDRELAHPRCPVVAPDLDAPIRWVRGVSLMTGCLRWVPAVL